jgi:hypothetical protein
MEHTLANLNLSTSIFKEDVKSARETLSKINPLHLFFELDVNFSRTGVLYTQGGAFNQVFQIWKKTGQRNLNILSKDDLSTVGKKLLQIYDMDPLTALAVFVFGDNPNLVKMGDISDLGMGRREAWFSGKAILVNMEAVNEFSEGLFEVDV